MMNRKNILFSIKLLCIVLSSTFLLVAAAPDCADASYYYLQVGSFRTPENASQHAGQYKTHGFATTVHGEEVNDMGYWYRVYVGPYTSWQEADNASIELRKKGVFNEKAFIRKKQQPIVSNLEAPSQTLAAAAPREKTAPALQAPAQVQPEAKQPPAVQEPAVATATARQEAAAAAATAQPQPYKYKWTPKPEARKQKGRQLTRGQLAVSLKHTVVEVKTELMSRRLNTSATSSFLSLAGVDKNSNPTSMQIDTLRVRYGVCDYIEIFGDAGVAFDEVSDLKAVYGGGARINIYEPPQSKLGKFYFDFVAEYLRGSLEEEYSADSGTRWDKESDWWWFTEKIELGVLRSDFSAYVGGAFFVYQEDTDRRLIENLPAGLTSYVYQDELEQENKFGIYGGVIYHLTPKFSLNFEGQLINQESISGSLEYRF